MTQAMVSRVNYFDGEALLRSDFDAEQLYHKGARERLSAGVFRAGVVSGLDVTWDARAPTQVTVKAGMALDCNGREIVLLDDETVPLVSLSDGKQNFLTMSYRELLAVAPEMPATEFKRIEESPYFDCTQNYDPDGPEVLLAVIVAQGGNIQSVRYQYGSYGRRHVGAALGEVEFVLESEPAEAQMAQVAALPQRMAITARQDDLTGERYLDISAPEIRLDGHVEAQGDFAGQFDGDLKGTANLAGTFSGTFTGNGAGLTGVKATGYWMQNSDDSLFYSEGNVGINDTQPSALLTVGQPVHSRIGRGLMTATKTENGVVTVQGYQTKFTTDMVGKILQFGVVLRQQATIASVDGNDSLTLVESFPLGLGPTTYGIIRASAGEQDETQGTGFITPDGNTVMASNGAQFQGQTKLNPGDVLVIDRFVPQQQMISSKIASTPLSDTSLQLTEAFSEEVTDSAYLYSIEPSRWFTGEGTISSQGKAVTGVGTTFTKLPSGATLRALAALDIASVPQTWRVDSVTSSTQLTMHKVSIDEGSPLLPTSSAFMETTWQLLKVGGEAQPATPPALTVVQNNGVVPNTVAINVDDSAVKINSNYALQVNGPASFEGGALDIDGDVDVVGNLHVTGFATIDSDLSAGGRLDVTGDGRIRGVLTASSDANVEGNLNVTGNFEVTGTSQFTGAMTAMDVSSTGTAKFSGPFSVTNSATFDVQCPAKFEKAVTADSVVVNKSETVAGMLTANGGLGVVGGATNDTLTVTGQLTAESDLKVQGTLAGTGGTLEVAGRMKVDDDLQVTGDLTVGASSQSRQAEIYGDLTVTGKIHGAVDIPDTLQGPMTINGDLTVTGSIHCQKYFGNVTSEVFQNQYSGTIKSLTSTANDQFIIINIIGVHNQHANGDIGVGMTVTLNGGGSYSVGTHFTDTSDDAPIWEATACAPVPKGSSVEISCANYKGLGADVVVTYINLG
ncbi:polymer-forming cytoskeletal protein [Trinickia sp. Y13]|uniref:polymer-forming cytoskeletal protein n=1 Tax=Trinickia sp. Y13 TaxID=2917807 RepID=UPI002405517F|nr:polymer-forming cytoskeletal protein [Trinickia sp. Y13]MDG0022880.1 polymer-forming cytoskeletal protein [Trinickia sp. Y13]